MPKIKESREILGEASAGLSDEEIISLRDSIYALAGIFVDTFLDERAAATDFQWPLQGYPDTQVRGWKIILRK